MIRPARDPVAKKPAATSAMTSAARVTAFGVHPQRTATSVIRGEISPDHECRVEAVIGPRHPTQSRSVLVDLPQARRRPSTRPQAPAGCRAVRTRTPTADLAGFHADAAPPPTATNVSRRSASHVRQRWRPRHRSRAATTRCVAVRRRDAHDPRVGAIAGGERMPCGTRGPHDATGHLQVRRPLMCVESRSPGVDRPRRSPSAPGSGPARRRAASNDGARRSLPRWTASGPDAPRRCRRRPTTGTAESGTSGRPDRARAIAPGSAPDSEWAQPRTSPASP